MKRIFVYCLLILFTGLVSSLSAQINQTMFWYETFGLGCNQGQPVMGLAPTATNGVWTTTTLVGGTGNGAQANEWFMSATEAGRPVGICGDGCLNNAGLTNRSIHIGSNIAPPFLDPGAVYLQTANSNTDKRVMSSFINCSGKNNIVFSFNYLTNGVPGSDFGEALYNDGINGWVSLGALAPSVGTCAPVGLWTNVSYPLPPSCDGIPNLRLGFRWRNSNAPGAGNISIAIDEVILTSPVVQFSFQPQACANLTFSPVMVNTVVPTTSYSWSCVPPDATFNPPNVVNPAITCSTTGMHTITCYALDASITSSNTATVNIVNSLVYTVTSSPTMICVGDNAILNVAGTGTQYAWNPATGLFNSPISVSPSVTTVFTVTGNDIAGCPGTGTVLVTIGPIPILNVISSASAVCTGFQATLTAMGANNYVWTGGTLLNPVTNPSVAVGPGTYIVVADSQTMIPCPATTSLVVGSGSPLNISVASAPQTASTCIFQNFPQPNSHAVQLTATGAGVYTWTPQGSLNYSIGPSVQARPIATTCYTVHGETSVCSGSAIVCVTVIPQFTVTTFPQQPILCLGDSLMLKFDQISNSSIAPYSYNWLEPANAPPPSMSNPLSPTVVIAPTNISTPVTYSAEVIDSRGCASKPRLITATVIPQPLTSIAIPTIDAIPTNSVCYVGSTTGSNPEAILSLTATNYNGLPPQYQPTYTWTSPYTNQYNPFPGGVNGNTMTISTNGGPVLVAAPIRTPQVVTYTIQSGFNGIPGCKRIDTVNVRVIDCRGLTTASFMPANIDKNDTICSRTCVTFVNMTDTMAGGPQTYAWTFPGGTPSVSTLKDPTICYNLPGRYNVVLKATSPYPKDKGGSGVFKSEFNFVKVVDIPNPKIVFTKLIETNPLYTPLDSENRPDTVIRFGGSVAITASNAATFYWEPNYFVSPTASAHSVTLSPLKTTQYILHGQNSSNCKYVDSLLVTVIDDCGQMFVPTAFSPNNDGVNDALYVRGLCLETLTFMVFNQWGEKVFETSDKNVGWDGTYKGDLMNTGVFIYRLEGKTFQGKGFSLKGNVTLIR